MKNFFKFFGLSFFSDRIASEASDRKVYTAFVSLFIAFILFVTTLVAADFCSFPVRYGKSDGFNALVYNAFTSDTARISLRVENGRIEAARNGGEYVKDKVVDSFTVDGEYAVDGYNLTVDTRSMDAYDAFEVSFEDCGISESEYAALPFAAKKNFTPKIILTDRERVLDDGYIALCMTYLDSMSDKTGLDYDKDISDRYGEVKNSSVEQFEKNKSIYLLYLQGYYPSLFDEKTGAPNLRNFYANEYMENDAVKNYLFVFEDMIVGSFESDGVSRKFYGYASKLNDGEVVTAADAYTARRQIDKFIKSAYNGSLGISTYLYFINSRRIFLLAIAIWLVLALISFGLSRAVKRDMPKGFVDWFKLSGAFILWSALITAVICFVCGFFVSLDTVFALITPLFGGIMTVRLFVFFLTRALRKNAPCESENGVVSEQAEVFDAELAGGAPQINSEKTSKRTALKKFKKRGLV